MDEIANDLLQTLFIIESMNQYLEKAWQRDARAGKEQLGWRTLNAIQKGTNRRLRNIDRPTASLDTLRAIIQTAEAGLDLEQTTVTYPLRPESQVFFRLTGYYWLHKFAPKWEVTNDWSAEV